MGGARDRPRTTMRFVTQLVGVALYMAERMAEEGVVSRYECDGLQTRLAAVLEFKRQRSGEALPTASINS